MPFEEDTKRPQQLEEDSMVNWLFLSHEEIQDMDNIFFELFLMKVKNSTGVDYIEESFQRNISAFSGRYQSIPIFSPQ